MDCLELFGNIVFISHERFPGGPAFRAYDNFDFNSNEGSSDSWVQRPLSPELPNVSNLTRFLALEMLMAAMMFSRWCGQPKLK